MENIICLLFSPGFLSEKKTTIKGWKEFFSMLLDEGVSSKVADNNNQLSQEMERTICRALVPTRGIWV